MERRPDRIDSSMSPRVGTVVDPRTSLALWLRAGRLQRGLSVADVARVTKIQSKILDQLEAGKTDGLPADVFVRGFVRSIARCVGLDEAEALRRYHSCITGTPMVAAQLPQIPAAARAMVDAMSDLAPTAARSTGSHPRVLRDDLDDLAAGSLVDARIPPLDEIEPAPAPEVIAAPEAIAVAAPIVAEAEPEPEHDTTDAVSADGEAPRKKRGRRGGKGRNKRKAIATGTPAEASPIVASEPVVADAPADEVIPAAAEIAVEAAPVSEPVIETAAPAAPWTPTMPAVVPSPPWRRPAHTASFAIPVVPSLVIDDADPDSAEQELEERAAAKSEVASAQRRSFLPPILLDREDRSARQGGLTLAVILLLIAATLTLSYLMRRPSSSGDGVTQRIPTATAPAQLIG